MKGALAIFVKTPGESPVKTRLTGEIGKLQALEFYRHSLAAVQGTALEVARNSRGLLHPWWAVGEKHTLNYPCWDKLPPIYTGPGGLGERLYHVYSTLLKDYDFVMLMGSDSPQISPEILIDAAALLIGSASFVLGPALDGGFYLLGGSRHIPRARLLEIPYSQPDTGDRMKKTLETLGAVNLLEELTDVDTATDLKILLNELKGAALPEQLTLKEWLKSWNRVERSSLEG